MFILAYYKNKDVYLNIRNQIKYITILLVFLASNLLAQNTLNNIRLNSPSANNNNIENVEIEFEVVSLNSNKVILKAEIPNGYYTYIDSAYANKIAFLNNNQAIDTIYPKGEKKLDDTVLYNTAEFTLMLNNALHTGDQINISYQLCLEEQMICLAPMYTNIQIEGLNMLDEHKNSTIINYDSILNIDIENQNVLLVTLLIFIAGFLSSLLPCSYPLIPITISVVSGKNISNMEDKAKLTRHTSIFSSLFFCLGLIFTYTLLGILISLAGYFLHETIMFGSIGYNPILLSIVVLFLMFFALSMFGLYNFQMPHFLEQIKARRLEKSLKREKVSLVDKFLIGSLMGIVASPCAAPIVATIIEISLLNPSKAIIYMALYGAGFSTFLFIIGLSSSSIINKMPKSGAWMNIVRFVFTVAIFTVVFYYLNTLLKILGLENYSSSFTVLIILAITLLVYLIVKPKIFIEKKLIVIMFSILSISLIGAFVFDSVKPKELETLPLEDALVLAEKENKNILIDFTAVWCVNCKDLKENVFSNDELSKYIDENYIFVEIDVDKYPDISKQYNVRWLPWLVVIDNDENIIYIKNRFGSFDDKMADIILMELSELKKE